MTDENDDERWEVYPGELNGDFAMFAVNVSANEAAPYANLRWMNLVRASFDALPNGMPSAETNRALYEMEDHLHDWASARGGLEVGRLTFGGRREFFVYTATDDADVVLAELQKRFTDFEIETFSREDPDWEVYREFLYPTPVDLQRIRNQKVVRALADHGDDPAIPRPIDHFAYFPDVASRRRFREKIVESGFEVDYEEEAETGDLRFGIAFKSHGPVDLSTVDHVTIPLFLEAEKCGGTYDGWGCEVTTG